jgi:bifunctional non-homologous end joining protein LigD
VSEDPLGTYRNKRRFDATPEPDGRSPGPEATSSSPGDGSPGDGNSFVVQKHAARRLHYDVRIEVEGVMASWAVPKGPSYDPKVKRLAVHVEDHPLDYQTFEGNIPGGEYGAGRVIVWDTGSFRNLTEHDGKPIAVRQAIERGHLSIWLEGTKLHGGWSLTRTGGKGEDKNWIMVKRRDDFADPTVDIEASAPASVLSGRDLEEIGSDPEAATWTRATATWVPPMLAELTKPSTWAERAAVDDGGWTYERKFDGLRCVAVRNGAQVDLWSRNHKPFTARFPGIVTALRELPVDNFTLDGEITGFDGKDFTGFGDLQQGGQHRTLYCVFDVLHLVGHDTRDLPLHDRKKLLAQTVESGDDLYLVPTLSGQPAELLSAGCAAGWEGLIAKPAQSTYVSGRSSDWRKLKCSAGQELVIGGWTEPRGTRVGFGALLVGYYADGALHYAGKVGTGFTAETLQTLYDQLRRGEVPTSPFADAVPDRHAHWTAPTLVANIAFAEWTRDGRLRHPSFQGLRDDKDPATVVRERSSG